MKQILLTQRIIEVKEYSETRDALDRRWARFLKAAGLLAQPLPSDADPEGYITPSVAGLILTGGNDLASFSPSPVNQLRDESDKRALEAALKHNLPLLAVCRGMQFLMHHFGGKLEKRSGHTSARHTLTDLKPAEFLNGFGNSLNVNSFHNYLVTEAAPGFHVAARADDGTIEAAEDSGRKLAAIMWHPEREEPFSQYDINLIKSLFGAR